jgi:hypothetical protein
MNRTISNRVQGFGSLCRLAALACVILGVAGCGKPDVTFQEKSDAGLPAEAVAVRKAFASATPDRQATIKEILGIVKAGGSNPSAYAEVLPQLQKFGANPTITAEQKQAIEALVQKLQTEMKGGAR